MNASHDEELYRYINLKLAALGYPVSQATAESYFLELAGPLLRNYQQKDRFLSGRHCPADTRIQEFLDSYFAGIDLPRLPSRTFVLDRPGLARAMSLPAGAPSFTSPYLNSYRVPQGILHNPRSDRRTTKGIFHIVEGGLPVPADKIAVPKPAFAALFAAALRPPSSVLALPFTANQSGQAHTFVSLLLRPLICPAAGDEPAKTMETRFFAPASLVSNLDFVESIFGNGGDPELPENDAALDYTHWSGHTGCVILAPHLTELRKKSLGLPFFKDATPRQRRDGMCWQTKDEKYNGGEAFKITCRDARGVIVTLIADNYYGYCKKEIKTQISFAANLFGMCEEEHAGGAIAFPAYVLGQEFYAGRTVLTKKVRFEDAMKWLGDRVEIKPQRYAIDRAYNDIFYVPENADFLVREGCVRWTYGTGFHSLVLRPGHTWVLPWGTKIRLEKQPGGTSWRLIASRADGVLCHKPCTVSGGGKSEISKSLGSILLRGPIFVADYHRDIEQAAKILKMDFSGIYKKRHSGERARRPILSKDRSLGSVIKLLTPSVEYTEKHNSWLRELPETIRQLLVTVKRYYRPEWGDEWQKYFTVDRINGLLGHQLKFNDHLLLGNYMRVGHDPDGSWRIFKLRPDFNPADKLQVEDDITASVVLPVERLNNLDPEYSNKSVKLVENCEALLFQRPDDAIYRGFDIDAEADIASPGTFLSNFEPLTVEDARAMVDHVVDFDQFTEPMKGLIGDFAASPNRDHISHVVSSANPRLVNGTPSKNPRYLQKRPDLAHPRDRHLAEIGTRMAREIPPSNRVHFPVSAVLAGRRNNPRDPKAALPPLAVYNPIHYQELPELFMDFICSLTGKSPSTTGFGSEGALTKGPFNALRPVIDVNNALVSAILTGYGGFTTAAGHIGPRYRVDHDNSMLVPEVWCRMRVSEREPEFLIANGFLEKVKDIEYEGRKILSSRLGYRITSLFVDRFLGRIFEMPGAVFPAEILRPEEQDPQSFVEGVEAICEAQRRVALDYFEDGSVEAACPPVKALLHIMAFGQYEGREAAEHSISASIGAMFTRDSLVASEWYKDRLRAKQHADVALWKRHLEATDNETVRQHLARVSAPRYLNELIGTIGADPYVR
ncbi:MAG TPA: hypothetical protein VG273_12835 [Bryobacteraceae bacterium]|nr:hypothetical protein [Bryobacteraceae bacterium]